MENWQEKSSSLFQNYLKYLSALQSPDFEQIIFFPFSYWVCQHVFDEDSWYLEERQSKRPGKGSFKDPEIIENLAKSFRNAEVHSISLFYR